MEIKNERLSRGWWPQSAFIEGASGLGWTLFRGMPVETGSDVNSFHMLSANEALNESGIDFV